MGKSPSIASATVVSTLIGAVGFQSGIAGVESRLREAMRIGPVRRDEPRRSRARCIPWLSRANIVFEGF